jgi:hypothetical protein
MDGIFIPCARPKMKRGKNSIHILVINGIIKRDNEYKKNEIFNRLFTLINPDNLPSCDEVIAVTADIDDIITPILSGEASYRFSSKNGKKVRYVPYRIMNVPKLVKKYVIACRVLTVLSAAVIYCLKFCLPAGSGFFNLNNTIIATGIAKTGSTKG